MPVLDDGGCRLNYGAVHVEKESVKGDLYRRLGVLRLRAHGAGESWGNEGLGGWR